jgi:hypothetical protein
MGGRDARQTAGETLALRESHFGLRIDETHVKNAVRIASHPTCLPTRVLSIEMPRNEPIAKKGGHVAAFCETSEGLARP